MNIKKKASTDSLFNELNNAVYWVLISIVYLIFIIILDVLLLYTQEEHEPHIMIYSIIMMAGIIIPRLKKSRNLKKGVDPEYFIEIHESGIEYGIQGLYKTILTWEVIIKINVTKKNITIECYDRILNLDKSIFSESEISQIINYSSLNQSVRKNKLPSE